jgi:hypothetical protein
MRFKEFLRFPKIILGFVRFQDSDSAGMFEFEIISRRL